MAGSGERCCDALVDGAWRRCLGLPIDHLERQCVGPLGEFERDGGHGGSCAVLDREGEIIAIAAEIEVGVAPGVEFGGSSQSLAGPDVAGALLGVVDEEHRDGMATLQFAQEGEQGCDFATGIFVDAVQAHEGIEDEQAWLELGDASLQGCGDRCRDRAARWEL